MNAPILNESVKLVAFRVHTIGEPERTLADVDHRALARRSRLADRGVVVFDEERSSTCRVLGAVAEIARRAQASGLHVRGRDGRI